MPGAHHGFQRVPGWQPVFGNKINLIAFMEGKIITGSKSIDNRNFPSGPAGCCQGRQARFFTGIRFSIEYNMQLNTPHNHIKKRTASDTLGGVPVVRYIMSSLSYQFFPVNSCFQVLLITFFQKLIVS